MTSDDIPIFVVHETRNTGYHIALCVLLTYPLGLVLGFSVPMALLGREISMKASWDQLSSSAKSLAGRKVSIIKDCLISLIVITPAIIIVLFSDMQDLISRDAFPLRSISSFAMGLADTLFWISLIGVVFVRNIALRVSALFFLSLAFAAAGERQAFVALFGYVLLDRFLIGRRSAYHYAIVAISVWLLATLIYLRSMWIGGILEVWLAATGAPKNIIDYIITSINYMTIFSVATIEFSIEIFSQNWGALSYAVNPLPSMFVGGQAEFLSIASARPNVPYAAWAMLYNHIGLSGIFLFGFTSGLALFTVLRIRTTASGLSVILLISVALVPYLFGMQYNLRAFTRVYYFLFLLFVSHHIFFSRIRLYSS